MLADDAIEPVLHTARQRKVFAVDRQHERVIENHPIEPVGHYQINSVGASVRVRLFRPFLSS